jgi:hypothetical protein
MSAEQRKHVRLVPPETILAVNRVTDASMGILANLSQGGFLLIGEDTTLNQDGLYQIELRGPSNHAGGELHVNLGAVCLWHSAAEAEGGQWGGFQIIDVSETNAQKLRDYLATLV